MYLKTNNQMPVHGTDGIHARYDSQTKKLHLYWGESKAHAKITTALSAALVSVKEFIEGAHDKREIGIVATYLDFDGVDLASKEAFLRYLDPYTEESNERIVTHTCLLVFEYSLPDGTKPDEAEELFKRHVRAELNGFISSISKTVTDKGLGLRRFEFFLLPVPSVQEFRDKFQSKIGWPV
jgi:hypothetical protein